MFPKAKGFPWQRRLPQRRVSQGERGSQEEELPTASAFPKAKGFPGQRRLPQRRASQGERGSQGEVLPKARAFPKGEAIPKASASHKANRFPYPTVSLDACSRASLQGSRFQRGRFQCLAVQACRVLGSNVEGSRV